MMPLPPNWPQSPHTSPPPWELQTEYRITKVEVKVENHEEKHEVQRVWNKGFAVALLSLSGALAHQRAQDIGDVLLWLAKNLRP